MRLTVAIVAVVTITVLVAWLVIPRQAGNTVNSVAAGTPTSPVRSAARSDLAPWTWIVFAVVLWVILAKMLRRGMLRRYWEDQPPLHRPQDMEATVNGIVVSTSVTLSRYAWPAFTRFVESANLFMLMLSERTFIMVPKRAFASAEELEAFRNMLRNLIAARPGGFPVEAAGPTTAPGAAAPGVAAPGVAALANAPDGTIPR